GLFIVGATAQRLTGTAVPREDVIATRVPPAARFERNIKADAAGGVGAGGGVVQQPIREAACEVTVRVGRLQLAARLVPLGRNATAAHEPVRLDFEQVAEVRAQ